MNKYPANPTDGMVYEVYPGIYYIFNSGSNSWLKVEGGLFPSVVTPLKDGLMSADDYKKLNRLIIPPPQTTLKSEDCDITYSSGLISLTGDDFISVETETTLIDGSTKTTQPSIVHQHTGLIDFKLDLDKLFSYLQTNGQISVRASVGDKGKRGEQGDPGEDNLRVGPDGEQGERGANAPQRASLSTEPVSFKASSSSHRGITDITTEEDADGNKSLVVTRSILGNPDACPTQVNLTTGSSPWAMAFPDNSVQESCKSIYYIDVESLVMAIEDKFKSEATRIKNGFEDVANYWLTTMSDLFDSQKAALCCALENCRSRNRNSETRRYIEQSRIAAAAADFKLVVGGQNDTDGEAYTYEKQVTASMLQYTVSSEPIDRAITVPLGDNCTVKSVNVSVTWSSYKIAMQLQVIFDGRVIYDTGCKKTEKETFEIEGFGTSDQVIIRMLTKHCGDPNQDSGIWQWDAVATFEIGCGSDRVVVDLCNDNTETTTYSLTVPSGSNLKSGESFTVVDDKGSSVDFVFTDSSQFSTLSTSPRGYSASVLFDISTSAITLATELEQSLLGSELNISVTRDEHILWISGVKTITQGDSPTVVVIPGKSKIRKPSRPELPAPPVPVSDNPTVGDHVTNPTDNPTVSSPPPTSIRTVQSQRQALHVESIDGLAGNAWQQTNVGQLTANGQPGVYWTGKVGSQPSGYSNTKYLEFTDYGFNIPDDATIVGIELLVERLALRTSRTNSSSVDDLAEVQDLNIKLTLNGNILSGDIAGDFTGGPNWSKWVGYPEFPPFMYSSSSSSHVDKYGGVGELFDGSFTASDINSCGFGVVVSATSSDTTKSGVALVKNVYVSVHYEISVQANPDLVVPSASRTVVPPVAITGDEVPWLKASSTVSQAAWVNFGNILNNVRTTKATLITDPGDISDRIGVSGFGTRAISEWAHLSGPYLAKVGQNGLISRSLMSISGLSKNSRVIGMIATIEDVETSGGEFKIIDAKFTRYRPNPGSTTSIVESAYKETDTFTADPIISGGCSTSIVLGSAFDSWGLELLGSDIIHDDKAKYTSFDFRVERVNGSGSATFAFSTIRIQVFYEDSAPEFVSAAFTPMAVAGDGQIDSKVGSQLVLAQSGRINTELKIESSNDVEISYSSDDIHGTMLSKKFDGYSIAKFPSDINAGLYYLAITNNSKSRKPIKISSTKSDITFLKGSGADWSDDFIVTPGEINSESGIKAGKTWFVHARIVNVKSQTGQKLSMVISGKDNSGVIRNAARISMPSGDYVAEITDCSSKVNGRYHAHVILSDGSSHYQFPNRGPVDKLMDLKKLYVGSITQVQHKGGDILGYIPNSHGGAGSGFVNIQFTPKDQYLSKSVTVKSIKNTVAPHSCDMNFYHLSWYQSQWQTKNCHGCVIRVANQDYIVVFKPIDPNDPSSENQSTQCLIDFKSMGHPAFAWPTFDGYNFAGIPTSGNVKFKLDEQLNAIALALVSRSSNRVGNLNYIKLVLFPEI